MLGFIKKLLMFVGSLTLLFISWIIFINLTPTKNEQSISENLTIPKINIRDNKGLNIIKSLVATTGSEISATITVSPQGPNKTNEMIKAKLIVGNPAKIIDTFLKSQGDLAKSDCVKAYWKEPTEITNISGQFITIKSNINSTIYTDAFRHCNAILYGPDDKTFTARIGLFIDNGIISIKIDQINVKNLGGWIEDKLGINKDRDNDILELIGIKEIVGTDKIKLTFSGDAKILTATIETVPGVASSATNQSKNQSNRAPPAEIRPYRDKNGAWHMVP